MSTFAEILRALVERVPGALGAIFADWDGEMIDQFAHVPTFDIQLAGAHWGVVLTQSTLGLQRIGIGGVEELLIEGEAATVLIRRVAEKYYVVLTARRDAHLATARRELERSSQILLEEM